MGAIARDLFDGDGTHAGGVIDFNELLRGGIFSGNQHVTQKHREGFITNQIAGHKDGVT